MIRPDSPDLELGVIGAGAMGQGIAQVALQGGISVVLFDARDGGAEAGRDQVFARLDRSVEKGRLEAGDVAAMKSRVTIAGGLADFANCHVVIEAVFEDLHLKQKIFVDLEDQVTDDCIIASNTSSLLIASIARSCTGRRRIAGMHFFNPVPLMKLVEVIRGPETAGDVIDFLTGLGRRMGRTPVVAKDAPGFLVNHGGRAYTTEAMRLLHDNVAMPAQIDAVMRDCCGFRMGPCELMDLTGVDVNYPVSQIIYQGFSDDPRLKTYFPHKALLEAGRLGRKTGAGNYRYDDKGAPVDVPSADHESDAAPATTIVCADPSDQLRSFAAGVGLEIIADDGGSPLVVALLGEDCSTFASRTGADFRRLVGIDLSCDTQTRVTIMTAPGTDGSARDALGAALNASGRKVTMIKDSPGFISQRVRAMIANLGCEIAQIGIAAPAEVDLAMKLGLNYPLGPLELAEHIGLTETLTILERLQAITGEDRYRPSLWLARRARLGLPIHTPD